MRGGARAHSSDQQTGAAWDDGGQLLKNYSRNQNLKTAITVGIVGFPNVGKSSIINSLMRTRAVGVGSTPGFTRQAQVRTRT
jgi:ribosome biogenesis GTPase A